MYKRRQNFICMRTFIMVLFSGITLFTTGCITINKYSRGYNDDLYYARDERKSVQERERYADNYYEEQQEDNRIVYEDTDTYTVYYDDCYSCLSWNVGFGWGWNYAWWSPYYSMWSPGGWYYRPYYPAYYYDPYWGWGGWSHSGGYHYNTAPRQYGPRSQRDNDLVNIPGGNNGKRYGGDNRSRGAGDYTSRPRRTNTSDQYSDSERRNEGSEKAPAYQSRPGRTDIGVDRPRVTVSPLGEGAEDDSKRAENPTSRPRKESSSDAVPPTESRPARRERTDENGVVRPSPRRSSAPSGSSGSSSSPSRNSSSSGNNSSRPTRSPR